MERIILHVDMDAFFAAVEQLDNPNYRGKPVIVGSDPKGGSGRGVVATCSYEARKFGIHSAMPISQAFKRCPHGIYVRGRHARYSELSKKMMTIFYEFTPTIQKISIDEAFLDITGSMQLFGGAEETAKHLKRRIKEELLLTASVGVAPNKFLAKIASDLEKPDGLVIVETDKEREFLKDLSISRLWGVGKKTEEALRRKGIDRVGQIAELSQVALNRDFGKHGNALWRLSQGIDNRPVETGEGRKSISQEITFEEDVADPERVEKALSKLVESLTLSMRREKIKGRTIILKIRFEDFSTYTRSRTFADFIDSTQIIKAVAISLFRRFKGHELKVRLVGVGVSQLSSLVGEQLGLFDQEAPLNRKLTKLLDSLRDKFGDEVVGRAAMLEKNGGEKKARPL